MGVENLPLFFTLELIERRRCKILRSQNRKQLTRKSPLLRVGEADIEHVQDNNLQV
jgi:hypothetical protein